MNKFGEKRYNSFSYYMKNKFGKKIVKLSLDGGFTCPNRDGTLYDRGCIFCSSSGSGDFTYSNITIDEQIKKQIQLISKKWQNASYIAYFQNFSNTYGKTIYELKKIYDSALSQDNVIGIAIATRPDCLIDGVIELLSELNKKTFLFVELGLQTVHKKTSQFLRLYYDIDDFDIAVKKLAQQHIKTVAHTIVGLPGETERMIMQTYEHLNMLPVHGVKIQMLNILKKTDLADIYHNFTPLLTLDEYVKTVCDIIQILRPDIVIHRLTGDGAKNLLIEPKWILNKKNVLNSIDKELKRRDTYQGYDY